MTLSPGTRLGPYEISASIGAGGMGEVYKARDTRLGRAVAIKVLPPGAATDPERRRRFEQEARAVAALNHPHICTLYDIGRDGGTDFLVMELVAGETLAARLTKGPLPPAQAIEFAIQIAHALAKAHGEGIVHRDLKPGNVMLTESGVKLLDFGLAKAMDRAGATGEDQSAVSTQAAVTTPGAVLGTLPYMAPEQVRGLPSDHRTDIFAFGSVLYEMLSGRRAFEGDTAADTMSAILTKDPRPLADLGITVPTELLGVVRRCLAKRPDDRFSSARELALALEAAPQTDGRFRSRRRPSARRRRLMAAAAVTALAGLWATLVLWEPWRAPAWAPASDNGGPVGASSRVAKPGPRVAVALFENRTGDPTLDLVGQQAADWVTDGLTQIRTADVALPPSYALGNGSASAAVRAAYTDPRKVADITGASIVVSGAYALEGEEVVFRTRLSDPRSGQLLKAFEPERGPRARTSDVLQAVSRAAVGAVAAHFDVSYDPRTGYPPSLEAYREVAQAAAYWYLDWDAVIRHLERALELDPQYARPRLQLALARFGVGDYAKAREALDALGASEGRLTEWEKQVFRAIRAHLAGRTWEYLAAAREQARLAPGMVDGPYDAAVMLYFVNHPAEAEALLAPWHGRDIAGGWAVSEFRAHVVHMAGRFEDQLTAASQARERYPTMLYFHEHQAAAQAALGRLDDLERTITDALTSQASSSTPGLVILVAAMELRAHGRRQESVTMAVRAADWYAAQPGDKYAALQTPNRGVEWYRSRPPDIRKRLREEQAMALAWAGRSSEVRSIVATLAREDPANVDYMGWLGVLAARGGEVAEARRVAGRLRALGRPYTFGSDTYWRACIAAQLGEKQQAVDLLQQAFTEGYWFQTQLHRSIDLEPLWGYPAFKELLRPKG